MKDLRTCVLVAVIVGLGPFLGGCATVHNVKDAPDFYELGEVRFFGGVRTDVGIIGSVKYPDSIYAFVDLPFSIVGDVLTAPFIILAKQWLVIGSYQAREAGGGSAVKARARAPEETGDPEAAGDPGAAEGAEPDPGKPEQPVIQLPVTHVVKKGESLYSIARLYYGHGRYWENIARANPGFEERLEKAEGVQVGESLTIPALPDWR